ncbi:MAG: porin, partial [Cyanobacteria bacterium K_DeepCast_0m_m1_088]|nr:porin [Cyanobacteria bacterium K_DeepCast_0m_m1_088]
MKLFQTLLLAPAALGLMAPVAASAADLNVAGVRQYTTSEEQVTSITQFSDVKPTDWAYQALSNLIERYGCVAGYPNGTYKGGQAMTRYEAAALLNACLDRVTEVTDEVKRLVKEFEKELAVLKGRVDSLEAKVGELEATQFSTTTKLKGIATFVLGGNSFSGNGGIPRNQVLNQAEALNSSLGATTFNYDLRLNLDTSFTGKDLLRTTLRAGNFGDSAYGTGLTFLEPAFESTLVTGFTGPNVVSINRLFYNFPVGDELSVTAGGVVRVDDPGMLGIWPSVYPADTVLDFFTYAGAPGAYNLAVLGGGAGFVYSPKWAKGLTISQNYVAVGSNNADPDEGGLMTTGTPAGAVTQIAYVGDKTPLIGGSYALAAAYTYLQGGQTGDAPCASGTPDACNFGNNVVSTNSIALSGYWKPEKSGFIPSISWGIGNTSSGDSINGGND